MNKEKYLFKMPAQAENLTIIRLTTSAIASKLNFSIDQIEDLKLCVSEVCNLGLKSKGNEEFDLEYLLGEKEIEIKFNNLTLDRDVDHLDISKMILQELVEDIEFTDDSIKLKLFV